MSSDLDVALEAARRGVKTIRQYQDEKVEIRYKGHNDLVTNADVAAEKEILSVIRSHFKEDAVLAEESSSDKKMTGERLWIIDPIDGTTNFAYNFPVFCVSVGLWEDKKPKVAVVIEVNRNEEFIAIRGGGAWLNGSIIRVSDIREPGQALIGTGFPYNDYSLIEEYLHFFRSLISEVQGIRRPGAATYDLCCVAAGRFQGFYEYALKAWDVGASALIVQEAGGVVSDWNGEQNWLFGERIIAGNPVIHDYLLEKIKTMISDRYRIADHSPAG